MSEDANDIIDEVGVRLCFEANSLDSPFLNKYDLNYSVITNSRAFEHG
jgi:hypothetical protein